MMDKAIRAIEALQNERGSLRKQDIIMENKDDEDFRKLLYYALNPMLTYKISEQTLRNPDQPAIAFFPFGDIYAICEELSARKALDDITIYQVKSFLHWHTLETERELYIKLLSKTLRLGVTAKTVNKVIPGLIPEWEVQQAYPIEKYPVKQGTWFSLTQKLNGVRATYYNGKLYARSGVPYEGLDHITDALLHHPDLQNIVFDGELTLRDKGGLSDNEAFRVATGIINSDSADKSAVCYTIFDLVNQQQFEQDACDMAYSHRRNALNQVSRDLEGYESISVLPALYSGTDQSKIWELLDQMVAEDKEGLMVNLDVPYHRRRHSGILKVKRFYTMDLPIVDCEEGSGRLAGTLGAFVLDYKGNEVRVGSGFSDDQRSQYWQRRAELPGTLCEVKYKEISSDKRTGAESLQFPVFISLRTDKTEPSYG